MRMKVPLIGYILACTAGAGAFLAALGMTGQEIDPLVGVLLFGITAVSGAICMLPLALPLIVVTERKEKGPVWLFLCAGVVAAMLFLSATLLVEGEVPVERLVPFLPVTIVASMTYWYYVWKRNDPNAAPHMISKTFE